MIRHRLLPGWPIAVVVAMVVMTVAAGGPATAASSASPRASVVAAVTDDDAADAAEAFVADRPAELFAGPDDAFVRLPVQSSLGWHYVPYERTYRGVPVIGGDFVVVVDPAGRVSSTSVAQRSVIRGLDVRPAVSRATAEGKASGSPAVAGSARSTRLVVEARGDAPRLTWESVLPAAAGPGTRTVEVDAVAGGVVRSRDDVLHDVGHAGLNGGNVSVPSALINCPEPGNCPDQHTWILAYPAGGGLNCNAPSVHRTDPEPLEWGDGDPTHVETACVDAMYVAGRENDMVRDWLGRNSLRGTGINDGFPMSTNSTAPTSYAFGPFGGDISIGRRANGVWDATLDILGHENGHGIDDHTPGDISGGGTAEFIGDAFGVATEWYANRPAPYDTPDYVIGDTPALGRAVSENRRMYDPSAFGLGVNCWSSDVPSMEVHHAAGVGDHWLYLLAEGSNPANGQPVSPTCNGSTVPGIGLRATMQILYGAMLMKNSSSSYLSYRTWTLTAARNLFPGNCVLLNKVRQAWDGVSVPAQPGEPACVPDLSGVTEQTAHNMMVANRLNIGSTTRQVSPQPVGTVIGQNPAPGTSVTAGTPVNLTVSLGGAQIPNVLRITCAAASDRISALGLVPSCTGGGPKVTSQSPLAGAWLPPGGVVTLTLSNNRTVPNVFGETCASASAVMVAADLTPTCSGNGTVTRTNPSIGETVAVGTLVRLTLSTTPPPPPPECPGQAIDCD